MGKKQIQNRLFEFRIRYNVGRRGSALDSFHYYMAESAWDAFEYHVAAMKRADRPSESIQVEMFNPWAERWEDKSEVLDRRSEN